MPKHSKEKFVSKVKIKLAVPHICKICNLEIKSIPGISTHVINKHDISYGDYIRYYLNIDVDRLNKEWDNNSENRKQNQLKGLKERANFIRGKRIKERMTEEEYISFRKSMKGVFSKEWYIKKYGELEGNKKYNERSKHLSEKTFWRTYNKYNKENWSKISQELFWEIYKRISNIYKNIYFGELNHEYSCGIQNCNFDFVVKDIKKVIEFNGDKFHANPAIYKSDDIPLKFLNLTSYQIWENDKNKISKLMNKNYDIKIIWESDYIKNKEKIILECLDFLLQNK
jgi:hypothetical protein